MGLVALQGAVGFLTRVPVGRHDTAWDAFRRVPWTIVVVGYGIGAIVVVPFLLPITPPTAAILFVVVLYGVTGITHVDGLGDLGDAMAVHADRERRQAVMGDSKIGVGAVLTIGLVLAGLLLAGVSLARRPLLALGIVLASEVGAKLAMVGVICYGTAFHEGIGSALTDESSKRDVLLPAIIAAPVGVLTWPNPAGFAALVTALVIASGCGWWSRRSLGGVNGDVIGATNEVARVAALHVGVIAWMHW